MDGFVVALESSKSKHKQITTRRSHLDLSEHNMLDKVCRFEGRIYRSPSFSLALPSPAG